MPHRYRLILALLSITLPALAGCTTAMKGVRVPEGFQIKEMARSGAGAPFDVNRSGAFASVDHGEIRITDSGGKRVSIADAPASAICFSPAGDRLAAALPSAGETTLRIFDAAGKVVGEAVVPGRIASLAWRSDKELLAAALDVRKFSFGSEMKSWLYQWDGAKAPVATSLADVTLRRHVAKLPEEILYNQLLIAVSPYGDEIAYTTLKDPPLFTPYLRVCVRHLESGADTEVAKTALGAGKVLYTPDGEKLIVGDGKGTRELSIPDGKEGKSWPSPGISTAVSPSGSYTLLDGVLYRGTEVIATVPPDSKGVFLADGSGLAISHQGRLYLVSGLKDRPAPALPADLERVLKLRRLRSQGLITESEYRKEKDKGLLP